MASKDITARWSFHRIWIAGKKLLVKRALGTVLGYELFHQDVVDMLYDMAGRDRQNAIYVFLITAS